MIGSAVEMQGEHKTGDVGLRIKYKHCSALDKQL